MKLYHGSNISGLKILIPKSSHVLNGQLAVFATPFRDIAVSFLAPWTDDDLEQGSVDGKYYMREKYPGAFEKIYKYRRGSIYTVSSEGFQKNKLLTNYERFSINSADVLKEEIIDDALSELRKTFFQLIPAISKRTL